VSVVFGEHSKISNLGVDTFIECYALTSITLPGKLKVIEERAFSHCPSLKRVVFNKSLKTIGKCAFQTCSALKNITLRDKLTVIEHGAFVLCTSLERVVCNKNLKTKFIIDILTIIPKIYLMVYYPFNSSVTISVNSMGIEMFYAPSALPHSSSAPSSKMSILHPNRLPSVNIYSLCVIA